MDSSIFLRSRPSFFKGAARLIDFGNTLKDYNFNKSAAESDLDAISKDFEQVGKDIQEAITSFEGNIS